MSEWDFSGLRAMFINCTLKKSPEVSNTQALVDASATIMRKHGVEVEALRAIDPGNRRLSGHAARTTLAR